VRRVVAAKRLRLQDKRSHLERASHSDGVFSQGMLLGKEQRRLFPEAMHSWRELLGRLISRHHQLVISAFSHFRLEPKVCTLLLLAAEQHLWAGVPVQRRAPLGVRSARLGMHGVTYMCRLCNNLLTPVMEPMCT
jgi:hypothetical protein